MAVPRFLVFFKVAVFVVALLPLLAMVHDAVTDNLGPDPIETLHFRSGDWTLRFLLITLACTPVRLLSGFSVQMRFRRMLGLFAFFYASLHMLVYLVLDLEFSWQQWIEEIPRSPYVIVGMSAYTLLVPLALTSTRRMMQRLGKNWKRLHRLVYVVAVLGVIHFFWLVKADLREPALYALVLMLLFAVRLWPVSVRRARSRPAHTGIARRRSAAAPAERGPGA